MNKLKFVLLIWFFNVLPLALCIVHTQLEIGTESGPHMTMCDQYRYFYIDVDHPCNDINVEVRQIEGEPNLYVSKDPVVYPMAETLAWASYNWGSENFLLSSWDPAFETGRYYIGVHAYCGSDVSTGDTPAKYTVLVTSKNHKHPITADLFNRTAGGILPKRSYHYYRFCVPSDCYSVSVKLHNCIDPKSCPTTYAWPELIVSKTKQQPKENDNAWILASLQRRQIILDPRDESVTTGHYYIGVYGWCTPEDQCNNESTCGPCKFAENVPYNVSVVPKFLSEVCGSSAVSALKFSNLLTLVFSICSMRLAFN